MSEITCFMMDRADLAQEYLRRWRPSQPGTVQQHFCQAKVVIAVPVAYSSKFEGESQDDFDHKDARWPKSCECGYVFTDSDQWQHGFNRVYRAPDGSLYVPEEAPAGAMYYAGWYEDAGWVGPDGRSLVVILPDRTPWLIDGPAGGNMAKIPGWQRTGVPPKVTATPSILSPNYHGFLTNGVLRSC